MFRVGQKGIVHLSLLALFATLGVALFIFASNAFNFKDHIFSLLFYKPNTLAKEELSEEKQKEQKKFEKMAKVENANYILKSHTISLKADKTLKNKYKKELAEVANKRKQDLKELMMLDPLATKELLLEDEEIEILKEAEIDIEEKTAVEGEFRSYHIETLESGNPEFKPSFYKQLLLGSVDNQQIYDLYSEIDLDDFDSHIKVKIGGYKIDSQVLVTSFTKTGDNVLGEVSNPTKPLEVSIPMIVIIGYTDGPNAKPLSFFQHLFSGDPGKDIHSYFQENTYGKTAFDTTFFGPYKAPSGVNLSINDQTKQFLQQAADANGADFTKYKRILYIINRGDGADGAGSGLAGDEYLQSTPDGLVSIADVWVGAVGARSMYFHELGHAFGNAHAEGYNCGTESFIENSRFSEGCLHLSYGDQYDVMGGRPGHYPSHYNALHKDTGGWFTSNNLLVLNNSGTYTHTITPIETADDNIKSIFIPRNAKGDGFSIEFKQPTGFDSWLADPSQCLNCNATKGVLIKYNKKRISDYLTFALDTTPNSRAAIYNEDLWDSALEPGKTFTDSGTGIKITTNSISSDGANVTIEVPNVSTCVRRAPSITATTTSYTGPAGSTPEYELTITNNDSSTCPPEQFKIEGSKSIGRYSQSNPDNFVLNPGETKASSFRHFIPNHFTDDTYNFVVVVCPNDSDNPCSTKSLNYTATSSADSEAPTAPTNLNVDVLGSNAVGLSWSASSDNQYVSGYKIFRDGVNIANLTSPTTSYIDSTVLPSSNYIYSVAAFDKKRNESIKSNQGSVSTLAKTDTELPKYPNLTSGAVLDSHTVMIDIPKGADNTGIVGYRIYRQDNTSSSFKSVISEAENFVPVSQTTFTDPSLISETRYKYYIEAWDGYGNSTGQVFGGVSTGIFTAFTPKIGTSAVAPVTNLGAFPTAPLKVVLVWDPSLSSGISKYEIYRGSLKIAETTDNYYVDTNVISALLLKYSVLAVDSIGNKSPLISAGSVVVSGVSSTGVGLPSVNITSPTNGATLSERAVVNLDLKDDEEIVGAELYVNNTLTSASTVAADWNFSPPKPGDPSKINWNTKILSNGSYTLFVKAYDTRGQSATSPSVTVNINNGGIVPSPLPTPTPSPTSSPTSIYSPVPKSSPTLTPTPTSTPDSEAPTAPTDVQARAVSSSQINLSWNAAIDNIGVTGYEIYRNNIKIASVTTTSYGDANLLPNTTYSYFIKALDLAGNMSNSSNIASALTIPQPTPTPQTNGAISGVVSSSSGGIVSGAKVSITILGSKKTYVTNSQGKYSIPNVPPASYNLRLSARGFENLNRTVNVLPGQIVTENITLTTNKSGGGGNIKR